MELSLNIDVDSSLIKSAIKPAAAIASIYLGQRIQSYKRWILNGSIKSYLETEDFKGSLSSYIGQTVSRVSYVTTLVFNQHKTEIYEIYVPLEVNVKKESGFADVEEECVSFLKKHGECYLISDGAGVGKSTFLKNYTLNIINEEERIPIFFEFSQFKSDLSLIDNLVDIFSGVKKKIDRDIFLGMLEEGLFIIILDGYDELSKDIQEKVGNELLDLSIKKGESTLIVSTRPQEAIPPLHYAVNVSLSNLSFEQANLIIEKIDKISSYKIAIPLIKEIEKVPADFIKTPLLVSLLYKTYSYNNTIADSITVFYSDLFDALYKGHDLTKNRFVRKKISELDIDAFRDLLRYVSFGFIFNKSMVYKSENDFVHLIERSAKLAKKIPKNPRFYLLDLLESVPLLTRDGVYLKYMHRTIAEFFAAEAINHRDGKFKFIKDIVDSGKLSSYSQVMDFFYEMNRLVYNEAVTNKFAEQYNLEYAHLKNEIYANVLMRTKFQIAIFPLEEVIDRTPGVRQNFIDIKVFNGAVGSTFYYYFEIYSIQYVMAMNYISKRKIPNPVLNELGNEILLDPLDYHHDLQQDEAEFIIANFDLRTIYVSDDNKFHDLQETHGAYKIFMKAIVNSFESESHGKGIKIISREKCEKYSQEFMGYINERDVIFDISNY